MKAYTRNNAWLFGFSESKPKEVNYNSSQYNYDEIKTDSDAGPFLRHTYTIKNLGPSDMSEAKVVFTWPSKTSAGKQTGICSRKKWTNFCIAEFKFWFYISRGRLVIPSECASDDWKYSVPDIVEG